MVEEIKYKCPICQEPAKPTGVTDKRGAYTWYTCTKKHDHVRNAGGLVVGLDRRTIKGVFKD